MYRALQKQNGRYDPKNGKNKSFLLFDQFVHLLTDNYHLSLISHINRIIY